MKEVPLTKGYVALVDDEDYERVMQYKWRSTVTRYKDGSVRCVYATAHTPRQHYARKELQLHRFILGVTDRKIKVDHINHNGLDNQRSNLRQCSSVQNNGNSRLDARSVSGIKGVTWHTIGHKWMAHITVGGRFKYLGLFSDINDAAAAYERAARAYFGEFANPARREVAPSVPPQTLASVERPSPAA